MRVMILGAGGHAQVVADILLRTRDVGSETDVVGYLDDNSALIGHWFLSLPVLGTIACLPDFPHESLVVGIGNNRIRHRLFGTFLHQGARFATACHPKAILAPDVSIGDGTVICAGVVVNTGSRIGADVILNTSCSVDHHNSIGDHVHIAPGVHLGGDVTIAEGTLVGIGATVIPQRIIGEWSIIGAGSVVSKDIPPHSMAAGAPARVIRRLDPPHAL